MFTFYEYDTPSKVWGETILTASDASDDDFSVCGISIDNDVAIIGACHKDEGGVRHGWKRLYF